MSLSKPAAGTAKSAAPKAVKAAARKPVRKLAATAVPDADPKAGAATKDGSKLAKSLREAGAAGSFTGLSNEALQQVLAGAVHAYAVRIEEGAQFSPFPPRRHVTATDVMVMSTAMLKAVGLQLFELGMWQAWTGRH
jgi:hypothetical protein